MIFHDATVILTGRNISRRVHDTEKLVAAAVEVFRDMLERHGDSFREPIPFDDFSHIQLQWTADPAYPGVAAATFWCGPGNGEVVTTSMLVSGRDATADRAALQQQQVMLNSILAGRGVEPAIDVLAITDRPLIVSTPFAGTTPQALRDLGVVADMETCLAAAFFLSLEAEGV